MSLRDLENNNLRILTKNKLYSLLILACMAGFIWLFMSGQGVEKASPEHKYELCLIKRITDIPCPSCGATRSVRALLLGDFKAAIYWNPFGIIILLVMIIVPFWISFDCLTKKSTFFQSYQKMEGLFQKKWIIILTILLVLSNWIWNIQKGL
ncbi:MAG: hypothetical protein ACI9XO_004751 [Paraglaciecola sp.]|jgi:hypothetical protein